MQNGALIAQSKQTSWLLSYLKTLCWQRFTASAAKRVAVTGTEYVLVSLLVPSALRSSVMFLATSTAGSAGKSLVSYGLQRATGTGPAQVMVAIPKEDLEMVQSKLQEDKRWKFSLSKIGSKVKSSVKNKAVSACHSVLNITYQDLSEGSGAFIGSTLASVAFVAYMGPPSLFLIPLYFLAEGCTKSVGAFIGKCFGRYYLGPKVFKPAILGAWKAIRGGNPKEIQDAYDNVLFELEKVNIEMEDREAYEECADLLQSWYLFKQKEPPSPTVKVSKNHDFVLINDYDAGQLKEATASASLTQVETTNQEVRSNINLKMI